MRFKLMTVALAILLAGESLFIFVHHHPANRFKAVNCYEGAVAFDTATGQLCKTVRTKTAAEIAVEAKADAAAKGEGLGKKSEIDPALPELDAIAKAAGPQICKDASIAEFVAALPACKDIRQ